MRLVRPAERDFLARATSEEMSALLDEGGGPPPDGDGMPAGIEGEVFEWWYYYDHVRSDLSRRHDEGAIPERGEAVWY